MDDRTQLEETAPFDPSLLSDPERGLDWPELEAIAQRLAQEPDGWQRVAQAFASYQRRSLEDPSLDEVAWMKAPVVLSLIGRQSEIDTRRAIAREMIEAMDRYSIDDDYGHEVLIHATMYLGPSILSEVLAKARVADPELPGWYSLLSLPDLAVHPEATVAEQALGIEACEVLLRRAIGGEIACDRVECVAGTLAALNHTPSVGLIKQAMERMDAQARRQPKGFIGVSELRKAYRVLTGKEALEYDPRDLDRLKDGLEPVLETYWKWSQRSEEEAKAHERQVFDNLKKIAKDYFPMPDADGSPFAPLIKPRKVGRNEPCPCGSGKKYKKCCGPKRR